MADTNSLISAALIMFVIYGGLAAIGLVLMSAPWKTYYRWMRSWLPASPRRQFRLVVRYGRVL